ncbi:MAG: hypothetical protein ACKVOT_13620 [Polaromonas sp.]
MASFGAPISRPISSGEAADLVAAREARKRRKDRAPATASHDEADTFEVTGASAADPVHGLADTADEDAAQDRRRSGSGGAQQPPQKPSLDVEG